MKILIRDSKIIGTATDEYDGPDEFISVDDDEIDITMLEQYQITEDGQVTLKIPESVTMRQARLILLQQGLLDDVETAINAIEDDTTRRGIQIEWEYAMDVRRDWPALQVITEQLGITDEQLDEMFVSAAVL